MVIHILPYDGVNKLADASKEEATDMLKDELEVLVSEGVPRLPDQIVAVYGNAAHIREQNARLMGNSARGGNYIDMVLSGRVQDNAVIVAPSDQIDTVKEFAPNAQVYDLNTV